MPGASKVEEKWQYFTEQPYSGGFRGDNENRGFNKETITRTLYHGHVWKKGKGVSRVRGGKLDYKAM
jgi:hypothetical protein